MTLINRTIRRHDEAGDVENRLGSGSEHLDRNWTHARSLIGALLARSSERQKWLNDNRKEECRELLTAMTRAADMYLEERSRRPTMKQDDFIAQKEAFAEYRRCLIVLQDRIFIAAKLREKRMFKLWGDTIGDFTNDGDSKKFADRLNHIKSIIIDIATDG